MRKAGVRGAFICPAPKQSFPWRVKITYLECHPRLSYVKCNQLIMNRLLRHISAGCYDTAVWVVKCIKD
jgi:hypothetical protein